MTDRYCLEYGRLREGVEEDTAGQEPAAIFHLAADGALREVSQRPPLQEGEGALLYAGDFYVEPLEIQIEFLKAANVRKWLEGLVLRHVDRVRQIGENRWEVSGEENIEDCFAAIGFEDRDFHCDYATVAGWALEVLEHIPCEGESFRYKDLRVTIKKTEEQRILLLEIERTVPAQPQESETATL